MENTELIEYARQQAARIDALAERLEMALRELQDLRVEMVQRHLEVLILIGDSNGNKDN